jgi:hypothetical protein
MLTLNGYEVLKLSTVVDRFTLKQGNFKQKDYFRYLEMARWAAKDIFRKTLWNIQTVSLEIDRHGFITIPDDCEKLLSIGIVGCDKIFHALGHNPKIMTVPNSYKCSCNKCNGNGTLCSALDNVTMVQTPIEIQGKDYYITEFTQMDGNGNLVTKTITPSLDTNGNVIDVTTYATICAMDVNPNGCLLNTAQNVQNLQQYCGYTNPFSGWDGLGWYNENSGDIPANYNHYGYWNWDNTNGCRIKIVVNANNGFAWYPVGTGGIITNNNNENNYPLPYPNTFSQIGAGEYDNIKRVIISYQSNGESPNSEIVIPQFAEMAVNMGMVYQQRVFNPKDTDRDKQGLAAYNMAKTELMAYLNPVPIAEMYKVQNNRRLW